MNRRRQLLLAAPAWLLGAQRATAQAGAYPSRTVRIVVPYAPGGSTDLLARLLATKLGEAWGQQVIVENRAGASGIIGNDLVAKAAPDGYTILLGITTLVQMPHLQAKMPYDSLKDFAPVSQVGFSADLLVVPAASPFTSLEQFVREAKANPGKFNYGSYGKGTSSHIHGEMFNGQAGLDLAHVPFKGAAPMLTDLLGGQITCAFGDIVTTRPHLKAGKVRALAITGARRFTLLPQVPTFTELGYRDYEPYGWWGVLMPPGTAADVVRKASGEINRILRLPDVVAKLEDLGMQIAGNSPDEFAVAMKRDSAVWGKVIKEGKITLD